MEEVIGLIIQLALEVGIQLFGGIGIDAATPARKTLQEDKRDSGRWWFFLFAILGGICGGISLLVAPKLLLPTIALRIANLILAPLIAGCLSFLFAKHVSTNKGWEPSHHFWRGFWFALVFGLVRFAYSHR